MSTLLAGGRGVPAGHGWEWIVTGWTLFKRRPLIWIAAIVVYALIFIALALVPIVGSLGTMVLAPVFAGGMVHACRLIDEGREAQLGDFFAGFRERFGTLVTVGLLYLAASVAVAVVVGAASGGAIWGVLAGQPEAAAIGTGVLLALLVMTALMLPVFMALWFAPPLVMFHQSAATEAMKASFTACLRNIGPFLVYGLVLLGLSIVASIPLGLGWLVLGPVLAGSLYGAYRDVFLE